MNNDTIPFWAHIHGASSHFPIAMMFASFAFDLGAVIFRRPHWRIVAFWALIVAAVLCIPTVGSGLTGMLGWFHVDPYMEKPSKTLLLHRNLALIGAGLVLILAIWRTISIERRHYARVKAAGDEVVKPDAEYLIYLVLLTVTTVAIGYAGYLGAYVSQGV